MPPRRADRSCSTTGCTAEFYAKDLCHRHYYRMVRRGDPSTFLIAQKYDKFDADGNRWCTGHKTWVSPDQFSNPTKNRCRMCRRLEKYRLGLDEFTAMRSEAPDTCPLCKRRPADAIDHDHDSGRVRGLLCRQCNIAIGTLTETGVLRAAEYLAKHGGRTLSDVGRVG